MVEEKRHIAIVTNTHLCNNPRLVKEIETLNKIALITVFFFQFDKEKKKFDCEIIDQFSEVRFISVDWTRKYNPERVFYTLISKLLKYIYTILHINIWPEQQLWTGNFMLFQKLNKTKADLYHGHNLGTLAGVVKVAKRMNVKCSFDAEDFHRGEYTRQNVNQQNTIIIENKYIPNLDLLISASPLITGEYKILYPSVKHLTINNSFPTNTYLKKVNIPSLTAPIKCIWFSQVVGLDRGIQDIIKGLNLLKKKKIQLDIIGAVSTKTMNYLSKFNTNTNLEINFMGILSTKELDLNLVNYDIGFASETPLNYNREICLTNKIFQYMNAGLAILATDTNAQIKFSKDTGIGQIYKRGDYKQLSLIVSRLIENPEILYKAKSSTASNSKNYSWEVESLKLKNCFNELKS